MDIDKIVTEYPNGWSISDNNLISTIRRKEVTVKVNQIISHLSDFLHWLVGAVPEEERTLCMEIGLKEGGSHLVWKQLFSTVISIEKQIGSVCRFAVGVKEPERSKIIWGDSTSVTCRYHVESVLEKPLDFLFIDGDHSYGAVEADYLNYAHLVRPGGVVAFHDANNYDVIKFLRHLRSGEHFTRDVPLEFDYGDNKLEIAAFIVPNKEEDEKPD